MSRLKYGKSGVLREERPEWGEVVGRKVMGPSSQVMKALLYEERALLTSRNPWMGTGEMPQWVKVLAGQV